MLGRVILPSRLKMETTTPSRGQGYEQAARSVIHRIRVITCHNRRGLSTADAFGRMKEVASFGQFQPARPSRLPAERSDWPGYPGKFAPVMTHFTTVD